MYVRKPPHFRPHEPQMNGVHSSRRYFKFKVVGLKLAVKDRLLCFLMATGPGKPEKGDGGGSRYASNVVQCPQHPDALLIEDYHAGDTVCPECGLVVGDRCVCCE